MRLSLIITSMGKLQTYNLLSRLYDDLVRAFNKQQSHKDI